MVDLGRQNIAWLRPRLALTVTPVVDDQRSEYATAFAGLVLERRAALNIRSQAALGDMIDVSESTVRRWEAGSHLPDAWELRRLAEVLGVSADQLLYPEPLSPRERELMRRAARQVRATRDRGQRAS